MKNIYKLKTDAARVVFPECPAIEHTLDWVYSCIGDWNPAESNDDAFNLETQLSFCVIWRNDVGAVGVGREGEGLVYESFSDHQDDKGKARRYAGLQAAALLGESLRNNQKKANTP